MLIGGQVSKFDSSIRRNPFAGYKPETEDRGTKTATVKENETIAMIIKAWKMFLRSKLEDDSKTIYEKKYRLALEGINQAIGPEIHMLSAEEIERFSLVLKNYEREKQFEDRAGLFLSALVELSPDERFTIYTNHLDAKINHLGFHNTKKVHVIGNLGWEVGYGHGNTAVIYGIMTRIAADAELIIDGNVDHFAGAAILTGKIVINGNAGHNLGAYGRGGEIHVNGDYASIGIDGNRTNIFHKGKQIEFAGGAKK